MTEQEQNKLSNELLEKEQRIKNLEAQVAFLEQENKTYNSKTIALANASPNAFIQIDLLANIEFLNLAAQKLLGLENREYEGVNLNEILAADIVSDIKNHIATVTSSQNKVESIFSFNNRYYKIVANAIKGPNSESVLLISTDITEQTNYESELNYKTILLRKVYDESANALLVLDAQTTELISCNKTTLKIFDFDDTASLEIIRNHIVKAKLIPNTKEDDENTKIALEKFGIFICETEFVSVKGRVFASNYQVSLFEINGKRLLFCKISDISEAKNVTKQLLIDKQKQKLHIEESPLGYLEWDTNFCVAEWNPSAEKIFGYTKAEAIGKHASFIIQDSEKPFTDLYWKNLTASETGSRSTHFNVNKNNNLLSIEWYNTPLYDENKKLLGISSLIDNITDKVKAEDELKYKSAFLETIYEEAFDGIMLFKPNTFEVITCNKRTFQIFEVDNLKQLNILMPNARKHKQNRQERDEMFEQIAKGQVHDIEVQFVTHKGNSVWLTLLVKLISFNNEQVELVRITDVSELKRINSKLNLDKQKQNIHIEQSPLGYVEWNTKFEVAEWNASAETIFGYTKAQAMGMSAEVILTERDRKDTAIIWQNILSYKSGHRGVYNNLTKDGKLLTIEWYDTPLFDDFGNVLGVSSLINDITDKIKHEEDLKYKTTFLETIYEEAFDGIMLFKPNSFEVINCNKRTFQIFETEDLKQLNNLMPNSRKVKQSALERNEMFSEIAQGEVYDKDIEFVTYKGNTVWLTLLVKLISLNGQNVELVRVTDVSELKKINSKLNLDKQKQTLQVEQSPLGYIEWNVNFEVAEWNPSAEKIFGYTKAEVLGKNARLIVPENVRPLVDEIWQNLKTQKGGNRSTNENITKDGKIITLEWYNTPLFDENNELLGVSSLIDDITEQIEAQKEIKKQLREKEILLSEIHHRVKNNLAIISGLLFMHAEHIDDESVKLILKESQSRIKSMAIIHEQLYQTENFGNINVNEYLKELVKKIANSFGDIKNQIDLDVEVNDFSMPISQALMIGLIINELVINSYKYAFANTDKGKIKIRFEKKAKHILRVSDNGVGYSENYNFEKSSTLGLNLVKILAKQLKGDVLFENKKGAYCTLIFN